jgi:hypothetical protein
MNAQIAPTLCARRGLWFGVLAALALTAAPVFAASPSAQADTKAQPQRARTACTAVRGDARDNCLSEASTLAASTRPSRPEENAQQLARNAVQRCAPLPEPDRRDCVARIQGQGTTTGSVAAGGIYRELVTREVAAVPEAAPAVPPEAVDAPK